MSKNVKKRNSKKRNSIKKAKKRNTTKNVSKKNLNNKKASNTKKTNIKSTNNTVNIQNNIQKEKIESVKLENNNEEIKKEIKKSKVNKNLIIILLIIIVLIESTLLTIFIIKDDDPVETIVKTFNIKTDKKNDDSENEEETTDTLTEVTGTEIPDKIGDYNVLGIISIDKIGVKEYILDQTTDDSLKLAVTKFYGPNINEVGNFCISGHNYKNSFAKLENLKINDTFYIKDKENEKKVTYKIYDKYIVVPEELDSLSQDTDGKREVTLITCTPDGKKRLIIKAKEI